MPEAKTGKAVQLLDLMVEYFEDDPLYSEPRASLAIAGLTVSRC
jgi:hypothetical protein